MGDIIATIGIFSDEANKSIEENGWLRKFPLTTTGQPMANMDKELLYGLYCMTNKE